jgi:catechol 2,3-dioxygenase-like lactoylglutathione lyase family enzyme
MLPSTRELSMTNDARLGGISPFFLVDDLPRAVRFYRERLGFELRFEAPPDAPFFAIVGREDTQIFLKFISTDVHPQPNPARHEWAAWDAFVFVGDPDALAAELATRGAPFRRTVHDRDDGLRGFEIADADGYVLFFGRPTDGDQKVPATPSTSP